MNQDELQQLVASLWQERRPNVMKRIEVVAGAAAAARSGSLSDDQRELAREEAHKLVGALGSYGFPAASVRARACEDELKRARPDASTLQTAVDALRAELPAD